MFQAIANDELTTVIAEDYGTDLPLPRQYAHFFSKTARKPAELVLTDGPSLTDCAISMAVAGKAEARRIAAERNAIVWNF